MISPAPWAVNPLNARVDAFDGGEIVPICAMLWPTEKRSEEETFANAKAIAAVPKMIEALKRVVKELDWSRAQDACEEALKEAGIEP